MSPTSAQDLMERRAAALAKPHQEVREAGTTGVVTVSVAGGRRYAVQLEHVRRVLRNTGLSRLPASAGELVGLIIVKGEAVPVADLGAVLGVSGPDVTRPLVVVLDDGSSPLGLLVDEVIETMQLPADDVRRRDQVGTQGTCVELGIGPDGVVLLDCDLLLADVRLNGTAGAPPPATRPAHHP